MKNEQLKNMKSEFENWKAKNNTVIVNNNAGGQYVTGLSFEGVKANVTNGDKADAIRYTEAEADELLASLGRGFEAEAVSNPITKLDELIEALLTADQITPGGNRDDVDRQTWTRLNDIRELITTGEVAE